MKGNHRSEKLDALLNCRVRIIFFNGAIDEGILKFSNEWKSPDWVPSGYYYLVKSNCFVRFRKSCVKKVEEL